MINLREIYGLNQVYYNFPHKYQVIADSDTYALQINLNYYKTKLKNFYHKNILR